MHYHILSIPICNIYTFKRFLHIKLFKKNMFYIEVQSSAKGVGKTQGEKITHKDGEEIHIGFWSSCNNLFCREQFCPLHRILMCLVCAWTMTFGFYGSLDCSKLFSLNSIYYDNPLQSRSPWNCIVGIGKCKCISATRFACIYTTYHIKAIESQLFQ